MKIHLIAIGGSIMHNLAMSLRDSGHLVTGSDDTIFEPAKSRLKEYGLLPVSEGWYPDKITADIDYVILGMHARADNPELLRALELGLRVVSFPEFVALFSQNKKRVVIAGSHGKTTTTSMVMHPLRVNGYDFDYLVGALLEGFDVMVRLSDAPIIIIEGDEYLSSALDRKSKFFHYDPHFSVITGVAWDHVNTFPTKDLYNQLFIDYVNGLRAEAEIFYFKKDQLLSSIAETNKKMHPYDVFEFASMGTHSLVIGGDDQSYKVPVIGSHNFQNLKAAFLLCQSLGMTEKAFLSSMESFTGASKRLQIIHNSPNLTVYKDFAHAPSKVRATVSALRQNYPQKLMVGILELHTYSSLNTDFLPEYLGSLDELDVAIVCYDPKTLIIKKMQPIDATVIKESFGNDSIQVFTNAEALDELLCQYKNADGVICFMSSGDFLGYDLNSFVKDLI